MDKPLREYNQKRRFEKTKEPRGTLSKASDNKLRFVVQHHIASHDHFDLRLELDGVLKSWAVPKGPSYNPKDKRLAMQVEDHPLDYRDFEGTIPKGEYGGGVVMVWDEGTWYPANDPDKGLAKGTLKFTLDGSRLKGDWALVHIRPRDNKKDNSWLLIKEKDEYENAFDVAKFTTSSKTGRTMSEIEEGQVDNGEESMIDAEAASVRRSRVAQTGQKTVKANSSPARGKNASNKELLLDGVAISNPDKILFPASGITKGDVARYYHKVAKRMLPYVEKRILSAVRCPKGISDPCFYKKHPAHDSAGVITVPIPNSNGEIEDYFCVDSVQGLLSEVHMNTLEFHTWGSRIETLEKPDVMVFDLDPDEKMDLSRVRQGVRDLKNLLDQLSLTTYLKTSGGKGYHIVIPFKPAASWEKFNAFAQNIAKTMEAMWPDRYTSNVRKNQRHNRIFIDWIRNGRGATSVAPYSVRTKEGAPISMPILWKELDTVAPQDITMESAIARLRRKDPWHGFFEEAQKLR